MSKCQCTICKYVRKENTAENTIERLIQECSDLDYDVMKLQQKNNKFKKVIEFYADMKNAKREAIVSYATQENLKFKESNIQRDNGQKAREAFGRE